MKPYIFLLFFTTSIVFCQDISKKGALDVQFLAGNTLAHSPDLKHLITHHPQGLMVSLSKKTFGEKEWQQAYNYPDYGAYFLYQDFKNPILGHNYALGLHYQFYFWKRQLLFKVAQGIAYASNPYNKEFNNKNGAFGSRILANSNFAFMFKKDRLIDDFGIQAGFIFTHYSNGRTQSPNSGINTFNLNIGIHYDFDKNPVFQKDSIRSSKQYAEPLKYNIIIRTGVNESPIVNSGQYPFFHCGFYVDKRINRKNIFQLGTEVFFTPSYKDFIKYQSVAYPRLQLDPTTDYKRIGIFIGHELVINKIALEGQLGYYVYQPFKYNIPIYDRLSIKYYTTPHIFIGAGVKTHGFLAEALELAIGYRL
ncbi:deacylase [Flavobacterium branchiophilum]|uniref:Lipid A 3-O-deacylase PagL n=1 Tax=Flavobacterium branchiophilum TaxID=55197 RepID=A0A543G5L1_9FLAO|nr:acyloxyacyl hydrolase [Flavobacterium branchiophilum]OXA74827.1 deacylase [Flavobacterium branchiophilum] [Flavobacterium branchiophilum NBRC 15030 = ATCC 35035]TQM41371.1 lipid A 3-O-deacylase PagL [Flavobacterium branchiophilum]GEM54999.1 hypothetical protein FB1_12200 [Flavobacterium branchiophilum NBRC 15030 = ATCC 35035]